MSRGMKSPVNRGKSYTCGVGRDVVAEVSHEAQLVNRFCAGCKACIPKEGTFPGCEEGVSTSRMAPAGAITLLDIVVQKNCIKERG